jgi:glucokinase
MCSCGRRGHLEAYAGANGVLTQLRSLAKTNPESDVTSLISTGIITPRDIAERAASGCDLCRSVIDQTAKHIGQAIGQLAQIIDPAVVLLGGAMTFGGDQSEIGSGFLEKVRSTVIDTTLLEVGSNLNIEFASLGNDAGVLGAAMVAQQAI